MLRRTLVLGLVLAMSAVPRPSGQAPPPGDGRVPWRVAEATIEPLARPSAGGNTILRVRFERGVGTPVRIPYDAGGVTVVLVDDGTGPDARAGDGLYTAVGSMDLPAFRRTVERLAASRTAQPASAWRTRAFVRSDARLDPSHLQPGMTMPGDPWGDPANIDPERSLLIRDPAVVQDPTRTRAACGQASMGPWSFGHLMEQLANTPVTGVTGAELAESWLNTWLSDQVVNTFTAAARPLVMDRILTPWKAASGGPNAPLDLSIAPFRLQAIVNRIDLRKQVAYGGGSAGAGELRFVFNVVSPSCERRNFQVILEFGMPTAGCLSLKALAQQWKQLDQLPLGSPEYNAALEAITEAIVTAGVSPNKPNGSALNQLRTNENHLDPAGGIDWEAREFKLDAQTHRLKQVTVAQTPHRTFNFTATLGNYVESHAGAITNDTNVVPLMLKLTAFRGASRVYGATFWDGPDNGTAFIDDRQARHKFSLQTCNGCHRGETGTDFQHVVPADFGEPIQLSGFMTGISVPDAADGSPTRFFDELDRRALDLDALLSMPCLVMVLDQPQAMPH